MATVGLSESLFERGQICGACFELRCVDDLRWCIPGTSIIVTATNFCAPNYGFDPDGGGHCNPPNKHFVLPIEAFEKIAIWKAGNMPVQYRRCVFSSKSLSPANIWCLRFFVICVCGGVNAVLCFYDLNFIIIQAMLFCFCVFRILRYPCALC